MKKTIKLTESDLTHIVNSVINEQETEPITTITKTSKIEPKHYSSVKQKIQDAFNDGKTVTITMNKDQSTLTGVIEGNTGVIPTGDVKNIIP